MKNQGKIEAWDIHEHRTKLGILSKNIIWYIPILNILIIHGDIFFHNFK